MLKIILLLILVLGIAAIPILNPKYQNFNSIKIPDVKQLDAPNFRPHRVSLENIFASDHNWMATLSAERVRTVIATGDVIPARTVNYQTVLRNDYKWPYEKTADFLRSADITFINLETPLIKNCLTTRDGMIFCGSNRQVEGLIYAGVDVASIANNHAGNYGVNGVNETSKHLLDNGILVSGVNGPVVKEVRGVKFAFLGYNDISKNQPGISNVDEEKIKQEIRLAKKAVDVVIVTFHWGAEYQSQPDKRQVELGRLAIDSGADLVIGNHPHWIQPVEIYRGKLITYAHGNFIFDQMWSEKTKQGVLGKYIFYDNSLIDVEYFPIYIKDFGQAMFLEKTEKQNILNEMKLQSEKLKVIK